jgi:hypothetical protein
MDDTIYTKPIEALMEQYEAMHVELAPLMEGMETIKKEIVRRVKERGVGIEHGAVVATYRNGYTRQSWDGKALKGYAAAHPEIEQFCKETSIAPSVSIKVG